MQRLARKRQLIFITSAILIGALALLFNYNQEKPALAPDTTNNRVTEELVPTASDPGHDSKIKPAEPGIMIPQLPDVKQLDVPFLVQAPNANWDPLHEDACEEASLIMIQHYLGKTSITDGDAEIKNMIAFEEKSGFGPSITLAELNQVAQSYLDLPGGRIENNVTAEQIKSEITAGRPVIIPAAGKILPNPNFRNGGPIYHMLVITGYGSDGFITNDPGTKRGKNFRYSYPDLINAIHDWDPIDILQGPKRYLVFD